MKNRLLLASASPRRKELLDRAGFPFDIETTEVDETFLPGEDPVTATVRVACCKAAAVASTKRAGWVVLGADTTVVCEGRALGKPADREQAVEMILGLAGRNHEVYTGWVLVLCDGRDDRPMVTGVARSTVRMRELSWREAVQYAETDEPLDKAGGYAVQGEGGRFVAAVIGSLDNVIGLPLSDVVPVLRDAGIEARRR